MARPAKSQFHPKNPAKYMGKNLNNIVMRSTWERSCAMEFDSNPSVLGWSSECVTVPYFNPIKQVWTIYKPDFFVIYLDAAGKLRKALMEVKPKKEAARNLMVNPTLIGAKNPRAAKAQAAILMVNAAKAQAALHVCQKQGWQYMWLTEDEIFQQRMVPGQGNKMFGN